MTENKPYVKRNEEFWNNDRNMKVFNMNEINNAYFESFRDVRYPEWNSDPKHKASWAQYKSRVGNFLDQLDKKFCSVEVNDIESYLESQPNARNFINGFMLFHIKEDTQGFRNKVSKDVLFYLLNV